MFYFCFKTFQVAYACIPLSPPSPNSTLAPTEAASEEPEASEAPSTTTTATPTEGDEFVTFEKTTLRKQATLFLYSDIDK